jgi:hypothetical protein
MSCSIGVRTSSRCCWRQARRLRARYSAPPRPRAARKLWMVRLPSTYNLTQARAISSEKTSAIRPILGLLELPRASGLLELFIPILYRTIRAFSHRLLRNRSVIFHSRKPISRAQRCFDGGNRVTSPVPVKVLWTSGEIDSEGGAILVYHR